MQLDKFSDYALRILMVLAVRRPETMSVRQVADIFEISENHLAKIATTLVREGYVMSRRGRAGGLSLARAPHEISVGEVLRGIQASTPLVECFGDRNTCRIAPACGLQMPLRQAQEAFFATLDSYSLADLTHQRQELVDLTA